MANDDTPAAQESRDLDVQEEATQTLGETGMVLPGVLTLFGFQLIVVFNPIFMEKLYKQEQVAHLVSLGLLSVAAAMVLAPAAFRRRAEPWMLSRRFIGLTSRMMTWAMVPLMLTFAVDFYLVVKLVLASIPVALGLTIALLAVFTALWFVLPARAARR